MESDEIRAAIIARGERLAEQDAQEVEKILPYVLPEGVVFDGSMLAPSWRILPGGAAAYVADETGDTGEVYAEALDECLEALAEREGCSIYWDEGMLWAKRD